MTKSKVKRKHTRFKPDFGDSIQIDSRKKGDTFRPDLIGLILTESFGGCGFVIVEKRNIRVGDEIQLKVGRLDPVRALVRWRVDLDDQITKLGCEYLS